MVPDHPRAGCAGNSSAVLETASLDRAVPDIGGGRAPNQLRLHRGQGAVPSSPGFAAGRTQVAVTGRGVALAAAAGPIAWPHSARTHDLAPASDHRLRISPALDSGYLEPAFIGFGRTTGISGEGFALD